MDGGRKLRWCSLPALFLASALVVGACGGDDEGTAPTTAGTVATESIRTDFGADSAVIRLGLLADLSGPFATTVKDIVTAQQVYWERVNDNGGIAGRRVELVIGDTRYDPALHKQKFHAMKAADAGGVLMLAHSTGSPHTAAIKDELEAAHMVAIPLAFFSGWADPAFGRNVFETYINLCFESINALQYLHDAEEVDSVAIISFPGEYGQDGAKGGKLAAERIGLDVVYDGEAKVIPPSATSPNPDNTGVVNSIVAARPDLVWASVNPAVLAVLMAQAAAKGFDGKWSGNAPSYHDSLLKSDVKVLIDSSYYQSSFVAAAGTDVPGMEPMLQALRAARPDLRPSDYLVLGWTEAQVAEAILRSAAADGDLTRAGVERAGLAMDKVDFDGLAPAQTWKGDPDDYVVRESYMYKPRLSLYREGPIGVGHTGSELLQGPFSSPVTDGYRFGTEGSCFKPAG